MSFLRFRHFNLRLKPNKCSFCRTELLYLGHIITRDGILPDPQKIACLKNYPIPKSEKAARSFIGFASYYRRFIHHFAHKAHPITDLLQKNTPFVWSLACQTAFETLISELSSAPILAYPLFDRSFIIASDASGFGIAGILSMIFDDQLEHPIAFTSRVLTATEKRYSTIEKECLALIYSIQSFKTYVYGRHFTLLTDHQPLRHITHMTNNNPRLVRWSLFLSEYDYEVKFKPGVKHCNVDGLSRMFVDSCNITTASSTSPTPVSTFPNTPDPFSLIAAEQKKDPELALLLNYLTDGTLPSDAQISRTIVQKCVNYTIDKHRLFFKVKQSPKLVVPAHLVSDILHHFHEGRFAAHLGVSRTIFRLKQQFYWPTLAHDAKEYIRTCVSCQERKGPRPLPRAELNPIQSFAPFQHIIIDLCGPWPITESGMTYVCVIGDHFTKFMSAYPLPNIESSTVANCLVEFICLFGAPEIISTDRGTQFTSKLFCDLSKIIGSRNVTSTSYHPQSQGLVERYNFTLQTMLSTLITKKQTNWDEMLKYCNFSYNTSRNETTKQIPAFLVFGRDLNFPACLGLSTPNPHYVDTLEYAHAVAINVKMAHELAALHTKNAQISSKKRHDQKAHLPADYRIGDEVSIYVPYIRPKDRITRKLKRSWVGPYRILDVRLPDLFVRLSSKPRSKADWVHVTRVKPFFARSASDYLLDPLQHDYLSESMIEPQTQATLSSESESETADQITDSVPIATPSDTPSGYNLRIRKPITYFT